MERSQEPSPGRVRQVLALAASVLAGAGGWILMGTLYFVLPVRWLPVTRSILGEWTAEAWMAACFLFLGWSAALGVSLSDRILRRKPGPPAWRRGIRGRLALAVCCIGLAAGVAATLLSLHVPLPGVVDLEAILAGEPAAVAMLLALCVLFGSCPTLGLLAARAAVERWLLHRSPARESC